ncbi:MAG: ATP synthase subunit I [Parasulfuritortus sp.]|nr:ATP synthase subunit I [Parasulfuritortus sp.]
MLISLRRAVLWQAGTVGVASLAGAAFSGVGAMLAILYGGAASVANLVLLIWRWRTGAEDYHCDIQKHLKGFYRSSLERFFVVGILLALWFMLVKSEPLAMLAGFLIGQLAGMTASVALRERI